MNIYTCGTTVELDISFQDANGDLGDPGTILAQVLMPDGTVSDVSLSIIRRDLGSYFIQYVPTLAGLYQYRVAGSGNFSAANEGSFYAQTSFTYNGMITPGTGSLTITGNLATRTP